MNTKRSRLALIAIPLIVAAAITVAADRPRPDGGVIDPSCNSSLACIEYDNNGSGPGVKSVSLTGNGSNGTTRANSISPSTGRAGAFGSDLSTTGIYDSGVRGLSVRGTGVSGVSSGGLGMSGTSTDSDGVYGTSTGSAGVRGNGVYGTYGTGSSYGAVGMGGNTGIYGSGTSYGAYGISSAGRGVYGSSTTGMGIYASSGSGRAVEGHASSGLGLYITNGAGNGADITGTYIGLVGRATNFPIVATNPAGGNLFYVDGAGNVFYHGSLSHFAATRTGKTALTYGATTAAPSVEDTGSGQLINGVAVVSLDPAFAQTIDSRTVYHVMLTPDGDTRGLYVASKGPNGFVVREVQGGRGSLTFDYHIYATALGHAGERMQVMTDAQTRAMSPRAPVVTRRPLPAVPFSR